MHTVELSSIPISNFSQALFHRNLISPQIPIPFLHSSNICLSSAKPPQMALSCSGLTFKLHVLEWSVIDLISNFMIVEGSDMKPADLNGQLGAGNFRTKIQSKMV
ncbi:hypothetical protein Hanom_Chr09g00811551 [Helianthus anomalus]